MFQQSFNVLGFDRIRASLASFTHTTFGRELAASIEPSADFDAVQHSLALTSEAVNIFAVNSPPFDGVFDIRQLLTDISLGSSASSTDLAKVLSTISALRKFKSFFNQFEAPLLKRLASQIFIPLNLETLLDNALDHNGSIKDSASLDLLNIRNQLRSSIQLIKDVIFNILHDSNMRNFFQDDIITLREDRYVLHVKTQFKALFPGIVHDQSQSGSTLFIEPLSIVNLNNNIRQLRSAEHFELERILRSLAAAIRPFASPLLDNLDTLALCDLIFAKAAFARALNASRPFFASFCDFKDARHPFIEKAVPVDLRIGRGYSVLVVSGPNTGGKSVALKTLGLLALMAQSGLYIPVKAGSSIAFYTNIFADIGDEQSIEQNLSTFSSHMTRIVEILKNVTTTDLVLIDEPGAGTAPEEGAALAKAILGRLLKIQCHVMVTTHYSELKTFAYSTAGIENACVEFDSQTLRPTYKLLIGLPGASNAFEISKRLGLHMSLIRKAKKFLKAEHSSFEQMLADLDKKRLLYEKQVVEIQKTQAAILKKEKEIAALKDEISKSKADILKKAKEKSAALIAKTKLEAESVIASLKAQFDDSGVKKRQQTIQQARDMLRAAEFENAPDLTGDKSIGSRINKKYLLVGDTIYVKTLDQKATVLSIDGEELTVQAGSLKMTVKTADCRFVSHSQEEEPPVNENRTSLVLLQKASNARQQLDIRGMRLDEAEQVCGKFLDDAQLSGLKQVLIIHGKGTGALRQGVHDFLRRTRSVEKFTLADIDSGGAGATLVFLK